MKIIRTLDLHFTLYTRLLGLTASLLAGGLSWGSPAQPLVLQAPPVPDGMKGVPSSHREAGFLLAFGLNKPREQCRGPFLLVNTVIHIEIFF